MTEIWLRGFLAGIFFMMTLVITHILITDRIKRREKRQQLIAYGKIWGVVKTSRESWDEFEHRLVDTMHHPSCRGFYDPR